MRRSAILLVLAALGLFVVVQAAFAAASTPAPPTSAPRVTRDDDAEEEGGEEAEECEAGAEEIDERWALRDEEEAEEEVEVGECGEEEAEAVGKGFVTAPPACLVRRAESKVATLPASDEVRLSVSYRTYSPTKVAVGLKLKDHKGSLSLAHATKHLGASGTLDLTVKLGAAAMARAVKASEFDVSLHAPGTPESCVGDLEQHLHIVRHSGKA